MTKFKYERGHILLLSSKVYLQFLESKKFYAIY